MNCFCGEVNENLGTTGVLKVNFMDVANEKSNLCNDWLI